MPQACAEARSQALQHVRKMSASLADIAAHLRQDVQKVDDPAFKALFETSAEVLGGLIRAFSDFEAGTEAAWKAPAARD